LDLVRVATYGFRGEALASIASVARIALRTRRATDEVGVHVTAEAGQPLVSKPAACPVGTDLVVEELFASVPARLAFLRTKATELGHVIRFVDAIALADPGLHISLRSDGRTICDYPPSTDLLARARAVFGQDVADRLHAIAADGDYPVVGALSEPGLSVRGPGALTLLVGGRPVRDRTLQHAVAQAYGPLLERGRYPTGMLAIDCPPGTVDVNVHPAKAEVRFVSSQAVHGAVGRAVRAMLAATPWLDDAVEGLAPPPAEAARAMGVAEPGPSVVPRRSPGRTMSSSAWSSWPSQRQPPVEQTQPQQQALVGVEPKGPWRHLRYIGQVGRCFLVFETSEQLVLIDQHAAHERVLFEGFVRGFREGGFPAQRMLIPPVATLQADEAAALVEHEPLLTGLGFEIEPAGERAVLIRAAPQVLPAARAVDEVRALAASLTSGGQGASTAELLERHAATLACHAAVRAGDVLIAEEVADLLASLEEVELAGYCPHGRPALMSASFDEVGRWFHRS
jgi:DNA mismatch repair protein MutL